MNSRAPYESATEKAADAIKEVATLGSKSVEATTRLAAFLRTIIGDGLTELGGAFNDWAHSFRYLQALKIAERVNQIHRERGITGRLVPIPPRLAIPLLDQATLEDNETLQSMWAGLIANSTDPASTVEPRRSYVGLLASMEPLDARVLMVIRDYEERHPERKWPPEGMDTVLNLEARRQIDAEARMLWPDLPRIATELGSALPAVALSLENIERLGLAFDYVPPELEEEPSYTPVPLTHKFAVIALTHTGRSLLKACDTRSALDRAT